MDVRKVKHRSGKTVPVVGADVSGGAGHVTRSASCIAVAVSGKKSAPTGGSTVKPAEAGTSTKNAKTVSNGSNGSSRPSKLVSSDGRVLTQQQLQGPISGKQSSSRKQVNSPGFGQSSVIPVSRIATVAQPGHVPTTRTIPTATVAPQGFHRSVSRTSPTSYTAAAVSCQSPSPTSGDLHKPSKIATLCYAEKSSAIGKPLTRAEAPPVNARSSSLTNSNAAGNALTSPLSPTSSAIASAANTGSAVKVQKVSSDTQTTSSAVHRAFMKRQAAANPSNETALTPGGGLQDGGNVGSHGLSSVSLNSDSTASCSNDENGKSSSNSNNSASSVDSVVCRRTTSDHISNLRSKKPDKQSTSTSTTATATSKHHSRNVSNERSSEQSTRTTTASSRVDGRDVVNHDVIKPMPPMAYPSSQYVYLRGPSSSSSEACRSRFAGPGRAETPNSYRHVPAYETIYAGTGYMSDGDVLHRSKLGRQAFVSSVSDDPNCGYMSEGGVSLYLKRMQQRFHEGMIAVQECIENGTNGVRDEKSMDDGSSVSSGDISDAVAEMSTDDNITIGSSLSAASSEMSPYRNASAAVGAGSAGATYLPLARRGVPFHMGYSQTTSSSSSVQSAQHHHANRSRDENWQKYVIMSTSASVADRCHNVGGGGGGTSQGDRATLPLTRCNSSSAASSSSSIALPTSTAANVYIKRSNKAVITDLKSRSVGTAVAIEPRSGHVTQQPSAVSGSVSGKSQQRQKRDSETNTDNSTLMLLAKQSTAQQALHHKQQHYQLQQQQQHQKMNSRKSETDAGIAAVNAAVAGKHLLSEADSFEDVAYSSTERISQQKDRLASGTKRQHSASSAPPIGLSQIESDPAHGSSLSLISSSSSVYSTAEEKQVQEIRKLRHELEAAHEKVNTLTTQLSTNAHVVTAFEQSLANMTQRLQHLTITSQQKDAELLELKQLITSWRHGNNKLQPKQQSLSPVSVEDKDQMNRLMSVDSMSSLSSLTSAVSGTSQVSATAESLDGKRRRKNNWLKTSITRVFSRKKSLTGALSDAETDNASVHSDASAPKDINAHARSMPCTPVRTLPSHHAETSSKHSDEAIVLRLKQQLHEKDLRLTDIQLEALSSAHQLEQLCETMNRMESEMSSLKADNERLQKMIAMRLSDEQHASMITSSHADQSVEDSERKKITVYVIHDKDNFSQQTTPPETDVGVAYITKSINWDEMDALVCRVFKDYVRRLDPDTSLGLNSDSVLGYCVGSVHRKTHDSDGVTVSPFGCLGDEACHRVGIRMKGTEHKSVDSLAFESLIPKFILERYVSLAAEHRHIILYGPSGTGKTYLSHVIARYLIHSSQNTGSLSVFSVDQQSGKELRQFLLSIADRCEHTSAEDKPFVVILDNLQYASSSYDALNGFVNSEQPRGLVLIGTMTQAASMSSVSLQLHQNFRWILYTNHIDPVRDLLSRYLRRRLTAHQLQTEQDCHDLVQFVDWLPRVIDNVNKFVVSLCSTAATLGPRLFLSCSMDVREVCSWFSDVWNYSVLPYVLEIFREVQVSSHQQCQWDDITEWVMASYPVRDRGLSLNLLRSNNDDGDGDDDDGGRSAAERGSARGRTRQQV